MLALYKGNSRGLFQDLAPGSEIGRVTRGSLGFGCFFFDANLDGFQDLLVINGHIDNTVRNTQYSQPPHLFLNAGGKFTDVAAHVGPGFASPKVGRGAAYGDIDNDGDLDVLITTNGGPAYLYRNDQTTGNRSLRVRLVGTESNRDGIGATVRIFHGDQSTSKTVKSGGSYLSQSELPVTFGLGRRDVVDRMVIRWPRGRVEEFRNLKPGRIVATEGKGIALGI
jgi:hypothetical protein